MGAADIVVGIVMAVIVAGVLVWYLRQLQARKNEVQEAAAHNEWSVLADAADTLKEELGRSALLEHHGRIRNIVRVPTEDQQADLRLFDYAYTRGPDGQKQRFELTAALCHAGLQSDFCIRPKRSRGFLSRLFSKVEPAPTGNASLDEHYEVLVEPGVPTPHLSDAFADQLQRSGESVTIEVTNGYALIYRRHERIAGDDLRFFADDAYSLATLLSAT